MALRALAWVAALTVASAQSVDFLELGSQPGAFTTYPVAEVKKDCGGDPTWECDSPPPKPEKAKLPPMPNVAPRVVRNAKCVTYCRYNGTVTFNKAAFQTAQAKLARGEALADKAMDTLFVDTGVHPASFLETEMPQNLNLERLRQNTSEGLAGIGAKPFTCRTKCAFPRQPVCNPVYNFRLGSAGMRPDEKECCMQCDQLCNKKQILWQYRVCVYGCRAFCPFKKGHWSTWEL